MRSFNFNFLIENWPIRFNFLSCGPPGKRQLKGVMESCRATQAALQHTRTQSFSSTNSHSMYEAHISLSLSLSLSLRPIHTLSFETRIVVIVPQKKAKEPCTVEVTSQSVKAVCLCLAGVERIFRCPLTASRRSSS